MGRRQGPELTELCREWSSYSNHHKALGVCLLSGGKINEGLVYYSWIFLPFSWSFSSPLHMPFLVCYEKVWNLF